VFNAVFDLSKRETFEALEQRYKDIVELRKGDQVATFLIGNKTDLSRAVSKVEAEVRIAAS
jgi:GTPase SAR1 family protein